MVFHLNVFCFSFSSCLRTSSWRPRPSTCGPVKGLSDRGSTEPYGSCSNVLVNQAPPPRTIAMPSSSAVSPLQIRDPLMWVRNKDRQGRRHWMYYDNKSWPRQGSVLSVWSWRLLLFFIWFRPRSWKVSFWRPRAQKARYRKKGCTAFYSSLPLTIIAHCRQTRKSPCSQVTLVQCQLLLLWNSSFYSFFLCFPLTTSEIGVYRKTESCVKEKSLMV